MAGYWPRSFLPCLWTETKSRSINTPRDCAFWLGLKFKIWTKGLFRPKLQWGRSCKFRASQSVLRDRVLNLRRRKQEFLPRKTDILVRLVTPIKVDQFQRIVPFWFKPKFPEILAECKAYLPFYKQNTFHISFFRANTTAIAKIRTRKEKKSFTI